MRTLLPLVVLAAACAAGPRSAMRPAIDDAPDWREQADRVGVWRDLADWYLDNGMSTQALDMVRRLRDAGEDTPELDLIQGRALLASGVPGEAQHILEKAAAALPHDPRPLRHLGLIYADLEQIDQALATLERAVEIDDGHAPTRNNLGFLLLSLGRCDEATEHLEAVLAEDATNARYRNNLAFALVCAGEARRALALFRTTGSEADARYNMGVAYERLDKYPSAVLQYQQSLSVDPTHEPSLEAIARLEPFGLSEPASPDSSPDGGSP